MAKTAVDHVRNARLYVAEQAVYVGRPGKGVPGPFGNPIRVGARCPVCGQTHYDGGETLPCFEIHARARMRTDPAFARAVRDLRGKVLLCFCAPNPCHGEVLAALAEEDDVSADPSQCKADTD